jgi:hypothetical protein
MCISCENDLQWATALGHEPPTEPCPREEKQPRAGHGRPVSDGPARHHANADPAESPAPPARMTQEF